MGQEDALKRHVNGIFQEVKEIKHGDTRKENQTAQESSYHGFRYKLLDGVVLFLIFNTFLLTAAAAATLQ